MCNTRYEDSSRPRARLWEAHTAHAWTAPYAIKARLRTSPHCEAYGCILLLPSGTVNFAPSSPFVTLIWQPNRDVSVSPNARSSISSSSSSGAGSESKTFCSRMRWHVEHARDPSHAPASRQEGSVSGRRARRKGALPLLTFELDLVVVRHLQQRLALLGSNRHLLSVLYKDEAHLASSRRRERRVWRAAER
eukprot:scaffold129221_cov28-Tisochrysis_lutea.AAC.1